MIARTDPSRDWLEETLGSVTNCRTHELRSSIAKLTPKSSTVCQGMPSPETASCGGPRTPDYVRRLIGGGHEEPRTFCSAISPM